MYLNQFHHLQVKLRLRGLVLCSGAQVAGGGEDAQTWYPDSTEGFPHPSPSSQAARSPHRCSLVKLPIHKVSFREPLLPRIASLCVTDANQIVTL